jgi:hypothetical protein
MGINRKIGAAITTTMLLALNVSSSPPATAIFRPSCTENSRGIGDVSATSTHNSVTLLWNSPGYAFQTIHVCYKKNWALQGSSSVFSSSSISPFIKSSGSSSEKNSLRHPPIEIALVFCNCLVNSSNHWGSASKSAGLTAVF